MTANFYPDDLSARPPLPSYQLCHVANTVPILAYGIGILGPVKIGAPDASFLGAQFTVGIAGIQNIGRAVNTPGREGGWVELAFTAPTASLTPSDASTIRINNGKPEIVKITGSVFGLPAIGFTLSQSALKLGSPQQNYADAVPLRALPVLTTGQR